MLYLSMLFINIYNAHLVSLFHTEIPTCKHPHLYQDVLVTLCKGSLGGLLGELGTSCTLNTDLNKRSNYIGSCGK